MNRDNPPGGAPQAAPDVRPGRRPAHHAPRRARLAWLVLLAAWLAGPSWSTAATPPGVLVVGQVAEPKSLDPHAVTAVNDFRILVNLYDGLVRFRPGTLEIEPALARGWDIAADGRTYTFELREGVRFHDGSPFDAQAVKFNFDRMLDPDHPYHDTGPFPLAFFFQAIERTEVVDRHTVRFHLDAPYAPLLSNLAYPTGLIVSPAAVRKHGEDYGRHPAGTGPFRFARWEPNRQVALARHAGYWRGEVDLEGAVFRPITDANARVNELRAGGVDLLVEVPPDELARFREDSAFEVHEQVGPHVWFLILDTSRPPFDDRRVRQAANHAVDKRAIVENLLQGGASIAAGPIAPAFRWVGADAPPPYPHDPERARELLASAGYGDGVRVRFYVPESGSGMLEPVAMSTAIQADLAEVGIDARIEIHEWNTYLDRVNAGLADHAHMAAMAWMTNDPDTLPFLTLRSGAMPADGGFNSGYYRNPEVDRLLERARRATDEAERARLYREVQAIVHRDAPWVFVAHWKQSAVTHRDVRGFALEPSFVLDLRSTSKP